MVHLPLGDATMAVDRQARRAAIAAQYHARMLATGVVPPLTREQLDTLVALFSSSLLTAPSRRGERAVR